MRINRFSVQHSKVPTSWKPKPGIRLPAQTFPWERFSTATLPRFGCRLSRVPLHSSLIAVLLVALTAGCATRTRVVEVESKRHTDTVGRADKDLFLPSRASKLDFEAEPLPPLQQREEFYVRWTGAQVDAVKFEYRQVNIANKIMEQTFVPSPRHSWHVFTIAGDDFINGGPVSAWRVSLWNGGQFQAEQKSAVW